MTAVSSTPQRQRIGAASLVVGPALMSIGDLFHPAETWDGPAQVAIIAETASRWFTAHLLLLIGLLLFVPGILTLTDLVGRRWPSSGYAARVLVLISVGALCAVFAFEMLLGSFTNSGVDREAGIALLAAFQSKVFIVLLPGLVAFFVGVGIAVFRLASTSGPHRWPAAFLGIGAALILAEIILAEVRFSQIGNILIFMAGVGFARAVLYEDRHATESA
jgi:hypothetical protein